MQAKWAILNTACDISIMSRLLGDLGAPAQGLSAFEYDLEL